MIYGLPVTCGGCGGEVVHVNGSSSGTDATGVIECTSCGTQWFVAIQLRRLGRPARRQAASA